MRRKDHLGIYTEQINIRLTLFQKQKIRDQATKHNTTISELFRELFEVLWDSRPNYST
jgi:hypothetical protein